MPAGEHPVFTPPADENIKIWRYMDFTKLVSMLESRGLFFCRADKLGDPFEGSLPRASEQLRAEYEKKYSDGEYHIHEFRSLRKWTMVSCWHMNPHESAAMWRLYAKTNEAIAVCSTYQKLKDFLDARCYLGVVKYIDYERDCLPTIPNNILFPFVHKRLSYKHEDELRAVLPGWPPMKPLVGEKPQWMKFELSDGNGVRSMYDFDAEPSGGGVWHPMDLTLLLEEIRIAPGSPQWFGELVEQVVRRYALGKPMVQSRLDDLPLY